jgi:hypothetical protein
MLDMLRLSRESGIWPERDVIKYIRSAIAIDGLITRFAPTFDLGAHLESVCERYLKWHVRQSMFTVETLMSMALPLGRLFRDGGLRAADALARLTTDGNRERPEAIAASAEPARRRAIYLTGFLATISLVVASSTEPVRFGLNLLTSEMVLAAGAFLLLMNTVRKLPTGE